MKFKVNPEQSKFGGGLCSPLDDDDDNGDVISVGKWVKLQCKLSWGYWFGNPRLLDSSSLVVVVVEHEASLLWISS